MKARILSALVGIPLALATLFFTGTRVFAAVAAALAALALDEYLRLCEVGAPLRWATLFAGAAAVLAVPAGALGDVAPLLALVLAAASLRGVRDAAARFRELAESLLGLASIGYAMGTLAALRSLPEGTAWILLVLAAVWAGDSAAYFVGTRFGRRRLAPVLSPKKSWEGAVAGLAGSVAGSLVALPVFPEPTAPLRVALAGACVGAAGQLADLFESLWKRAKGVKDSGTLIPGHGGVLDRIDSLLLAVPVAYFLSQRWAP